MDNNVGASSQACQAQLCMPRHLRIDHHAEAFERHRLGQGQLGELDVSILHAIDALGAAEIVALGEMVAEIGIEQIFNLASVSSLSL